jgi:hypothetical protein
VRDANILQIIENNDKTDNLDSKTTHHKVLSCDRTHCAQLQHFQKFGDHDWSNYKTILTITEIAKGAKREYVFPSYYFCQDFKSIAFNKQGTKVVAIGDYSLKKNAVQRIVTEEEHQAKSIMTFGLFLKIHWICKSLISE